MSPFIWPMSPLSSLIWGSRILSSQPGIFSAICEPDSNAAPISNCLRAVELVRKVPVDREVVRDGLGVAFLLPVCVGDDGRELGGLLGSEVGCGRAHEDAELPPGRDELQAAK